MSVLFQLLPTFPPRFFMGVLWDNQLISGRIWSSFDLTPMCALTFFCIWTASGDSRLFIGAPVDYGTIEEVNCGGDWASVRDIPCMIRITICVKEVGLFLSFSDFCISWFEVKLMGNLFITINFIFWVHDGLMWMVHRIPHVIFYIKKARFYWWIYIDIEAHCDKLKIIESLESDVHESINPVI